MTYMSPETEKYKNVLEDCGILKPTSLLPKLYPYDSMILDDALAFVAIWSDEGFHLTYDKEGGLWDLSFTMKVTNKQIRITDYSRISVFVYACKKICRLQKETIEKLQSKS